MRAFVLLGTVYTLGCSYPVFAFVPTDVGEPAMDADATVEDDTGPTDTGGTDSFISESANLEDATDTSTDSGSGSETIDARPDSTPDVPLPSGCAASTARFCVDWDKSTTPSDGFVYATASATGSVSLDMMGGRSIPNAFLAATSPGSSDVVNANLTMELTTATTDGLIRLDGWVKLQSANYPTTDGTAFLFKIQRKGGMGDGVTFSIGKSGFFAERLGVTYGAYPISTPAPREGVWMHVRFHTRLDDNAGSLAVWLDDMTTPVVNVTGVSTARADVVGKQLIVGLYSQRSTAPFRVRYDDVELNY